jgi:hypothetical protein
MPILRPRRLGAADRNLEPVVAEVEILDAEGDELGAAAAARETQAEQSAVPGHR